jgi:hypothetical protein
MQSSGLLRFSSLSSNGYFTFHEQETPVEVLLSILSLFPPCLGLPNPPKYFSLADFDTF